jgi:hypothetical protein
MVALPKDRRHRRLAIAAIVAGAVGGYFLFNRIVPHDDLQQLLEDASNTLGSWTYLLAGVFGFAETGAFIGLVVPGETVMLVAGAVAGQGAIDVYILIGIAWFAAWAGDTTSASRRSRTTSPATAAKRSSSGASSASSGPWRRSSPAAPGCRTASSSPTASSAPESSTRG